MATEDIRMNKFQIATDADYFYAEDKDGNQVKILKSDVMSILGNWYYAKNLIPGEVITLPYSSGLILVQSASREYEIAISSILGNNNGTVLVNSPSVNFFSEISNKINVLNTGANTKYVVKNSTGVDQFIRIRFLGLSS